jgi:hypothetical protein
MRIQVDDSLLDDDDLLDAEYVKPKEKFIPGVGAQPLSAGRGSTRPSPIDLEPASQKVAKPASMQQPKAHIGLDLNFRKLLTTAIIFLIMFGMPVAMSKGLFDPDRYKSEEVYTTDVVSQEGQVAGLSTNSTNSSQTNSNALGDKEILGVSMGMAFVVLGLGLIAIPAVVLLK